MRAPPRQAGVIEGEARGEAISEKAMRLRHYEQEEGSGAGGEEGSAPLWAALMKENMRQAMHGESGQQGSRRCGRDGLNRMLAGDKTTRDLTECR